ncbi:DUF7115 domain-containing protein [Halobacterium zhouii]|uniref:DUF7115 domain-containing protein n=1 Tax=Halobacterium zhouii TaxID=2902624 RepID=UPI001E49FAFA|nr:hypothetical protein [Halobacterium zhouii]
MNAPALVQSTLGDEEVAAHVPLKGEDALFVTGTRTLVYTAEGLISDESVTEHSHDAERILVSDGRRKAKITLDYGLDGETELSVPSDALDDALHPIVAGVLNAADVTQPGETVKRTYRFSELTIVVTSDRVVKHVGAAVWEAECEQIGFDTVTGIDVEEGSVSSQLVLETTGRTQRIKAPNEQFRDVRETVEDAVYAYHDVSGAGEFEQLNVNEEPSSDDSGSEVEFGEGVDPIDTSGIDDEPPEEASREATATTGGSADASGGTETTDATAADTGGAAASKAGASEAGGDEANAERDEFASSGFETATSKVESGVNPSALGAELDELETVVEEMSDAIEKQRAVLDAQQDVLDAHRERLAALRELAAEE